MRGAPLSGPLDELAAHLAVPARSGLYLTRNELVALARLTDGSLRVGERRRMLADVLKSAPSTEALLATVSRLASFCAGTVRGYRELAALSPAAAPLLAPWIERAERSGERLAAIAAELRQ